MQFLPGSLFEDIYAWTSHHVVRNPGHRERLCVGVPASNRAQLWGSESSEDGCSASLQVIQLTVQKVWEESTWPAMSCPNFWHIDSCSMKFGGTYCATTTVETPGMVTNVWSGGSKLCIQAGWFHTPHSSLSTIHTSFINRSQHSFTLHSATFVKPDFK